MTLFLVFSFYPLFNIPSKSSFFQNCLFFVRKSDSRFVEFQFLFEKISKFLTYWFLKICTFFGKNLHLKKFKNFQNFISDYKSSKTSGQSRSIYWWSLCWFRRDPNRNAKRYWQISRPAGRSRKTKSNNIKSSDSSSTTWR